MNSFRLVDSVSALAIAQGMLDDPYAWESLLQNTDLWWDLTRFEYKYGEPLDWSAKELLDKIETTWMDGDSRNQLRIHQVAEIGHIPAKFSSSV